MKRHIFAASSLTALALCAGIPAHADEQAASPGAAVGLQEVVVTARRRSENISNVPATISAITSESLQKQGIHTEADLQIAVPGLVIRTGNQANQLNFVIRGESVDSYSGSVPGVQPYLDEVPFPTNGASTFYDVSSVEVLKGPQGTLFGRNSTGGAVLYETTRPQDHFGGYASVQYGNLDRLISEAALNLPLVADKVLLRVAGTYGSGGGFEHNLYDGATLGGQETASGRISLLLKPTERLSNLTTVQYTSVNGSTLDPQLYYVLPCGSLGGSNACVFTPSNPAFEALLHDPRSAHYPNYPGGYVYPGGLVNYPGFLRSLNDPYTGDWNAPTRFASRTLFVANTTTFDLASWMTIKNIFGYSRSSSGVNYDDDGSPYPVLQSGVGFDLAGCCGDAETNIYTTFSDELQAQGKAFDKRLSYIVGFYYDHDRYEFSSPISGIAIFALPGDPPTYGSASYSARYHIITTQDTYAPFAQATFAITDRLNLTGGVRYTFAQINDRQGDGSVFGEGHPLQVSEDEPSWTATLDYKLSPPLMVYVTTRGSWRVGGYTIAAPPKGSTDTGASGGNYFLPEEVRDVEVGAKYDGRIAGIQAQLNADVFQSWITNVQKSATFIVPGIGITGANTVNVPQSVVQGVEVDGQIAPTPWLRLGGNLSYTDARFTQNQITFLGATATFGPYGDTPKWSGSAFGEIALPLRGDMGSLSLRTDVYAQSSFYFSQTGNTVSPGTKLPGYALVNMRLDWSNPMRVKGLTASLFVKNLGNKLYYTGGDAAGGSLGYESANLGLPRTYGFVLRQAF